MILCLTLLNGARTGLTIIYRIGRKTELYVYERLQLRRRWTKKEARNISTRFSKGFLDR